MVSSSSTQSDCALMAWKSVSIATDRKPARRVLSGTVSLHHREFWLTCREPSQLLRKRKLSRQCNAENSRALCAKHGSGQIFKRKSANTIPGGLAGDRALKAGNASLLKCSFCQYHLQ